MQITNPPICENAMVQRVIANRKKEDLQCARKPSMAGYDAIPRAASGPCQGRRSAARDPKMAGYSPESANDWEKTPSRLIIRGEYDATK